MEEQILAVQRMQDYIEAHLGEELGLADLARVSMYSPWYSYRLFVRWVNMTPAEYIRRLRLSRSALRLRGGQVKVAELAFELGFGSVDGYQRAFYRAFGCNPGEYARAPVPLWLFTPYGVKYRELRKENEMENAKTVFVQLVEKPARRMLIRRWVAARDYFAYCEEVGCEVWGLLTSLGGEPVSLWLPEHLIAPGTSEYVQGAELEPGWDGPVPEGFEILELPAASYLRFQGEPFAEEDYCAAIEQVQGAIGRYDPAALGYMWDDKNPRIQLEPVGERGYIELVAVKEKQ